MYPVSNAYIEKISEQPKDLIRRIRGTVDNVPFTENDLVNGSFSYVDKCLNSEEINLGGVFIGQIQMTFLPSFGTKIARGTWHGRTVTCNIGLLVDPDNDTWESVPIKPFTIDEANHSKNGIAIKAYDSMRDFDKPFNMATSSGSLYDFAALACQVCGVTLGLTEVQMQALPNGTETLALYPNNDCETWRDLISWIAVSLGGYACINRDGALEFRVWHDTADIEMDINDRSVGGSWSDFTTYYTGLSIVNIEDETTSYYSVNPDTGLTMNIGSNPLLQYGTNETKTRQRMAILTALQEFVYVPYNSSGYLDPCFDLGDVVEYTDGLAGASSICCIHKMEYKYSKGMSLVGFGKNPALFGARNKTDKNIAGLLSKTSENENVTHTFINAEEINLLEDTPASILKIRFATINPKTIKLFHEINFDLDITDPDGDAEITAYYYLDDDLITFHPVSSWDNEGMHILPLMYFLENLEGGRQYTWEVRLECTGGSATIAREGVHAFLEAQGLVATEEWDGILELSDAYSLNLGNNGYNPSYSDSVEFDWRDVMPVNISDAYALELGDNGYTMGYSDSVTIETIKEIFRVISEDGDSLIVSEDDANWMESEQ